jgi:pimeloyl-ACP methyl ester carboxylesterase
MKTRPSIVFAHGLWADGSCFSKLIVPLQAEGYECIAAQYGLNTTAEDVAVTKVTIGRVSSPVILVGHSYGGSVITGAGVDDPEDRRLLPHRSRGWTYLAASRGHEVFLRRPFGAGAEAGLGDPGRPETRPVRGESWGNRMEVETELVHRG